MCCHNQSFHSTKLILSFPGESTTVHMDYSTDFPSLPVSIPNGASSSQRAKMPLPVISKNSTLVRYLPKKFTNF